MLIKNTSVLLGNDLRYVPQIDLQIRDQKFSRIQVGLHPSSNEESIDSQGLIMIPGLVNCHTHIGDSIGKDVTLNSSVNNRIHPIFGAKAKILSKTKSTHLVSFMKNSCQSMLQKGITTFVDFRENGLDGINLLKSAVSSSPIRSIILGRINLYHDTRQIRTNQKFPTDKKQELVELLKKCDGLGLSGANENSDTLLAYYSKTSKIRAIHAAETKESTRESQKITKKSEVIRALRLKPHFLIHMTHATPTELSMVAKKTRGIVLCPRANASLAEGIPDFELMAKLGCNITLGTDNVMINSPDMFREMDYLWKVTMGIKKHRVDPKTILQMATVNAGKLLRKNIGVINKGKLADAVFLDKHAIDLEPMHSPHASIVHRASDTAIRAVMIGGKIVYGKI